MNNIKRLVNKSDVPEDGTCTICCSLMFGPKHDPKLFNPCKHLLCTDCDIKVKDKCPICRSERKGPSTLNQELKKEIGHLNAVCKGWGCFVEGKLNELPKHESACRHCQHCCRYCTGFFPKGIDHEMKCWYKCRYCKEKLLYKDCTPKEHDRKCSKFPVCCLSKNLGCRRKLTREELEAHIKTCPFHQIRDFLRLKQLQFDRVKLQMLTTQKSEMLIRKEHLEAIVKHQKLLGKYQALFKEHVKLMEKIKIETTRERDRLLLVKKSRGTEVKYIKLSEQFILVVERNKKLRERIMATDQQLRREAIKRAMSENRSKEFNRLLEEFVTDSKVQYKIQHSELLKTYKKFLTIHEDRIKDEFEKMLNESAKLFIALYGEAFKKEAGLEDEIETIKDNNFNFLRQYHKLMSNQVDGVGTLFSGFVDNHLGIQERQLGKLSGFFGLTDMSSEKDNIPSDILEVADFRHVAPQVLRSYNINQLRRKIKLLEGLRDGKIKFLKGLRDEGNSCEEESVLATPQNPGTEDDSELTVSPDEETKPVFEIEPSLKLDMDEFRLRPLPSVPDFEVDLNAPNFGTVPPEPLEDEKEPLVQSMEEMTLSDEKEQGDEKEPIHLPSQTYADTLLHPSGDSRSTITSSNPPNPTDPGNQTEPESRDGQFTLVDVGLGIRPIILDPAAVARALQEGSRRLLGIGRDADAKTEDVD